MTNTGAKDRFAGVVKIVRFNVHFYVISVFCLVTAAFLLASAPLPSWLKLAVLCGGVVLAFWTMSSLLVSWYVYDHVGVTRWQWLRSRVRLPPDRWVNVHAGFDESTAVLRELFPGADGTAVDIYDPRMMTEPSIARARGLYPSGESFKPGKYNDLSLPANSCDAVFLLFAAHEVRTADHRTQLLRESARLLRKGGCVVLVEHLRDWTNFLAFGPGFLHFHSRRSWLRSIRNAGLLIEQEFRITPFVDCCVLRRADR